MMAELPVAAEEVYAPPRTMQAWRALVNWLTLFYHIFLQILPSFAEALSYLGFRHGSLLSSPSTQFKPLTDVELPETVGELDEAPPQPSGGVPVACGGEIQGMDDPLPLEKLTVVLDLDETLVCAYETISLPVMLHTQAVEAGLEWFELECNSSDKELDVQSKINHVTVFERPGLKEFLNQLSEFADLVLFTAGLEGYASPLVDRIDTQRRISQRLYRQSTISTHLTGFHAYLSLLDSHMTNSFWKSSFHCSSNFLSKKMCDRFCITSSTCLNGFKGMGFPLLDGQTVDRNKTYISR